MILRNTTSGSLPVLPRYDLPNAAPPPLREVQLLLNSQDLENEVDWLPDWLAERDLARAERRARALREALRALVRANNGTPLDEAALETVNLAARRVSLSVDSSGGIGRQATAPESHRPGLRATVTQCKNCMSPAR